MALLSKGTQLKVGDGEVSEAFTLIPGVQSITIPAVVNDEIEVTDLQSTAKEYIAGLGDAGEFSFAMILKPAGSGSGYDDTQELVESYAGDGSLHNFQVVLPAPFSTTYEFAAFVREFRPEAQTNAAITANVTLRVSGSVTRTAA